MTTLMAWQQVEMMLVMALEQKPGQVQEEVELVVQQVEDMRNLQPLEQEVAAVEARPPFYGLLLHSRVVSTAAQQYPSNQQA